MKLSYCFLLAGLVAAGLPVAGHAQNAAAALAPAPAAKATAQPGVLRLGVGRTEVPNRPYYCLRVAVEYTKPLGSHWGASGRLVGIGGAPQDGLES
ncbi:hypothetical protein [Hymenobacter properus]|uniref:Uncharacterized protein n=1 Tax=Hymenobacter properus TaxID=2791026 RepID=A0A931BGG6_9BACT|nr:hypothetical protein [Hymenobacter properus]MBF9143499.1 hypothetical protein [Hymenobacter properus]MBR7722312.1 hypothetical protein [Microvirga sp. SRT04]